MKKNCGSVLPVRIGRQWYGVGITDVAKEETVIGSQFDNIVNRLLRKRLGKKKSEDMLMILKASATASNIIRPNFKPTREALKTAGHGGNDHDYSSRPFDPFGSGAGLRVKMGKSGRWRRHRAVSLFW